MAEQTTSRRRMTAEERYRARQETWKKSSDKSASLRISKDTYAIWNTLKEMCNAETNDAFAKLMLEKWYKHNYMTIKRKEETVSQASTSDTLDPGQSDVRRPDTPADSDQPEYHITWPPKKGQANSAQEEENMDLDCNDVINDGVGLGKQPSSVPDDYQYLRQVPVLSGNQGRNRNIRYSALDEETCNKERVCFQAIHGLPVNVPFTLQYLSPCAGKTLKSGMYIIMEQRVTSYTPYATVNIKVQGQINEHVSEDNISSIMKDVEEEKMTSWVYLENMITQTNFNTFETKKASCEVSDSYGIANEPIIIKQEIEESCLDTVEEDISTNRHTVISDSYTNDMDMSNFVTSDKTDMFDGMIPNFDEFRETKKGKGTKEGAKSERKIKRKSSDISYNVYETKRKLLKIEETPSSCQSERQSSRMQSKGFRIDYGQLNDPSDVSDLDDIYADSELTDTCDEEEKVGTSDGNKKHKKPKIKEEDPDFCLAEPEPENEHPDCHSESAGNDADEDLDLDMEKDNEENGAQSSLSAEEKREIARQKYSEQQMLKRIKREKSRIKVKLCEHTDKYTVEEHVSFEMKDRAKGESEKTTKMLVCTLCKKFRTENEEQLEQHIEKHLNGELSCKECNFHACNLNEWKTHNRMIHRKAQIIIRRCPICSLKCKDNNSYRDHLSSIHNLSHVVCKVCLKAGKQVSFSSADKLHNHFLEEHKDLMHQCTDCGRYFRSRVALVRHSCLVDRSNTATVPCEICGKVMRKDSIPSHKKRVHFQIRSHPCPHCSYAAKLPWHLMKHIEARHEGVHAYQCDQCTFSCVRHSQLVSHKRTHTGDKPYKCDECPYAAAWNVQLKDHKKIHSNPLGVECKICRVVVKLGAAYTKHMKKEHDVTV